MVDRKCVSCGKIQDKKDMIKITKDFSTGRVIINKNSKQFGRSAYLCYNRDCIETGIKKNKISKALRCTLPEDVKGNLINEF